MIFLIGIERSATTWLSNILDMHARTDVIMEPLSKNVSCFEDWPDRFIKLQNLEEKARRFNTNFKCIEQRKKFLFTSLFDARWAWKLDLMMARQCWDFFPDARDFFELHFNRWQTTGFPKKKPPLISVIKELRLNFNGPLISKIDPEAKVVVMCRNYAATVQSIFENMQQGHLNELKSLLKRRYGDITIENIFDYWAESYNTLLQDLNHNGRNYLFLRQKNLIKNSQESIDQLFDFVGLEPSPNVWRYVNQSNRRGGGKHNTQRNHQELLKKNSVIEEKLRPRLAHKIDEISWHPLLQDIVAKSS